MQRQPKLRTWNLSGDANHAFQALYVYLRSGFFFCTWVLGRVVGNSCSKAVDSLHQEKTTLDMLIQGFQPTYPRGAPRGPS